MATPLTKKSGNASSSFAISASDINHRLGNSETAEVSMSDTDPKLLFYHGFLSVESMNFQEFLNKTKIVTGSLFDVNIGYQADYSGSQIGSITEDRMASANNGGWYAGASSTQLTIRQIMWNQSSSTFRVAFQLEESVSGSAAQASNGWSSLSIRARNQGTSFSSKQVFKNSYSSFNSSTGTYTWSDDIGSVSSLGSSSGLERYIEIE